MTWSANQQHCDDNIACNIIGDVESESHRPRVSIVEIIVPGANLPFDRR